MRVLAGAGVCGTGRVVTHTGLGWMGGLVLRMLLAFNVAEPGRTEGDRKQTSRTFPINQPHGKERLLFNSRQVNESS